MADEKENGRVDLILKLVEKLGFPAVVCGVLLYGAWVFGDRVTDAHLTTLKVVQEAIKDQTTSMKQIAITLDDSNKRAEERTVLLKAIMDEQQKTTQAVKTITK